MELYTRPASFRAQKIIIAAEYGGVKVTPVTDISEKKLKELSPIVKVKMLSFYLKFLNYLLLACSCRC